MAEEQYDKFIKRMQSSDEQQQPEMPAAAWEKMEAKLDDAFGKKKKRRRFFWLFLLAPLLLAGTWFSSMLGVKTDDKSMASGLQKTRPSSPKTEKAIDSSVAKAHGVSIAQNSLASGRSDLKEKVYPASNVSSKSSGAFNGREKATASTRWQDYTSPPFLRNAGKHRRNKAGAFSDLAVISKRKTPPSTTEKSTPEEPIGASSAKERSLSTVVDALPHHFPPDSFHLSSPLILGRAALDFAIEKKKTKSPVKSSPRFFAGLSGMYTASGVSLSRIGKGTSGYGFHFGLLWKRFSLSAGLNAGNVIYAARGDEYILEDSYNPYGSKLQSVDAKCYILDIPVVANYIFPAKHRTTFFAGLGVASQVMKREDYDYVSLRNGMTWKGTWSYKNQNKHFLSLLQIGAGINHQFSKTVFLQASPFFRMPLKGIGEGSVHLRTLGLQASLNFFPFSAKNN